MIPRAIRDYVAELAAAHPAMFRRLLQASAHFAPNYWIFNTIIQQCGGAFITTTRLGNGMQMRALMGDMVSCHISRFGFYEPELVDLIKSLLTRDTMFFDIGAHIGQHTLLAAGFAAEVHSFEPNPAIFRLLSTNVASNNLSNVRLNNFALADFEGDANLHLSNSSNTGHSSLLLDTSSSTETCRIRCQSLDAYLREANVDLAGRKVLVKVDVEGAELSVFRGASLLLEARPTVIFEVLPTTSESDVRELLNMFASTGYVLHAIGSHRRLLPLTQENRSAYSNVLATPLLG